MKRTDLIAMMSETRKPIVISAKKFTRFRDNDRGRIRNCVVPMMHHEPSAYMAEFDGRRVSVRMVLAMARDNLFRIQPNGVSGSAFSIRRRNRPAMSDTRWINETATRYGKGGDPSLHRMMQVAIDAERERCAKIIETAQGVKHMAQGKYEVAIEPTREQFADAIRNSNLEAK